MGKKKKLIICWSVILVLSVLSAIGIFVGEKVLLNKLLDVMSSEMSATVKYVPKILSVIGYSEIPEDWDEVQKAGAIIVTGFTSDSNISDTSDYLDEGSAGYIAQVSFIYKITDPDGNDLSSGTKTSVETEKCTDDMSECLHTTYGYMCVNQYFENDLGTKIDELIRNNENAAIRVDSYVMNNNECIPLTISVLDAGDDVIETIDCSANCPADLQGNKVTDSPLYVHNASDVSWGPNDSLTEARDYLDKWIADNHNLTGENTKSKTDLKEGYTVYYNKNADYSYYVLMHTEYGDKTLTLPYLLVVGTAVGVLCFIGAIVTIIICLVSKKKGKN